MSRSTAAGSPARSAPSRNATSPVRSTAPSGVASPPATRATRFARRRRSAARERQQGDAPDRARGGPQRLRGRRVGAARGERDRGAEGVRRPDQRADVSRVGNAPERERRRPVLGRRQILPPVDPDHARRVCGGRDLREQARLDVLPRDEQRNGLGGRRGDEVLALADEQPELVPPAPLLQLADELELLVLARADQRIRPIGGGRPGSGAAPLRRAARPSPARRSSRTRRDR